MRNTIILILALMCASFAQDVQQQPAPKEKTALQEKAEADKAKADEVAAAKAAEEKKKADIEARQKKAKAVTNDADREAVSKLLIKLQKAVLDLQAAQVKAQSFVAPFGATVQKADQDYQAQVKKMQEKYDAAGCELDDIEKTWVCK